jgi:hypothetical protein
LFYYFAIFKDTKTLKSLKDAKDIEQSVQTPEGLFARLKTCLQVQARYKEAFRALRDGLGGSQALSSFPSVSSLHTSDQSSTKETTSHRKASTFRRSTNESKNHGILMSEEDVIFSHIDAFCSRAKHIIDQMTTLSQYQNLAKTSIGLSRPKKEDLGLEYGTDDEDNFENDDVADNTSDDYVDTDDDLNDAETYNEKHAGGGMFFSAKNKNMDPLVEEEIEEDFSRENSLMKIETVKKPNGKKHKVVNNSTFRDRPSSNENSDTEPTRNKQQSTRNENEIYRNEAAENLFKTESRVEEDAQRILKKTQTLSKEDLRVLRKHYNRASEGPTVTAITNEFLGQLIMLVKNVNAKSILDVETKDATT